MSVQQILMNRLQYILVVLYVFLNIGCNKNIDDIYISDSLSANGRLIYEDTFEKGLDNWKVEQMPNGTVQIKDNTLEINDAKGCTIWFTEEIKGPSMIVYDAVLIDNGGAHDRVSDLNCFWMAKDLYNPSNLFKNSEERGGKFTNYDSLRLYYMGVGGHFNTRTRFRRYIGNGERPLLPEHDFTDSKYLLKPNHKYNIKILTFNNIVRYYRNDTLFVDFYDSEPYTSGYFGLRTVNNHMIVDNFKVYELSSENK